MLTLDAGAVFPKMEVPRVGGGLVALGDVGGAPDWQMVVVYRGLHCPICKRYLTRLEGLQAQFHEQGVGVVAVSGDPEAKARALVDELELTLPMGYGLDLAQMRALGLYVSDPRSVQETDRPFPEPGLFVINAAGRVQIVDVSNAPFARPDLEGVLNGITFIRANDYPVRGTHGGG